MEIKKTGKLFSFCCMAPAIIKKKNLHEINFFEISELILVSYFK